MDLGNCWSAVVMETRAKRYLIHTFYVHPYQDFRGQRRPLQLFLAVASNVTGSKKKHMGTISSPASVLCHFDEL